MVNRSWLDVCDNSLSCMLQTAVKLGQAPSAQHLRNSGAELLRAVRCSLDEMINLLDPQPQCHAKADSQGPEE